LLTEQALATTVGTKWDICSWEPEADAAKDDTTPDQFAALKALIFYLLHLRLAIQSKHKILAI
jgi:hypothetical protein